MGMGGQHHAPAAGREGKISPPPGFDSRTGQHVAIPSELSRATLFKGLILHWYKTKALIAPYLKTGSVVVISVGTSNFDLKWFQTDRCSSRLCMFALFFIL